MNSSEDTVSAGSCAEGYAVGYGKPPKHTQFKKGSASPNPSGRPKGAKGLKKLYEEAFEKQKVTLNFNGKKRKAGKKEAGMHMLAQKVSTGDLKAIAMMLQLEEKLGIAEEPGTVGAEAASHNLSTLENLIKLHAMFVGDGGGGDEPGPAA
jgi:hypothetical protein